MPEKLHIEILTSEQKKLLPMIGKFSDNFYLVGGTAIALYLGHRQSIDFDLFTNKKLNNASIHSRIRRSGITGYNKLYEAFDQIHLIINGVKITFFDFPFIIPHRRKFNSVIPIPSLLDLAAMKAFAFGGRGKWKDYVDMYFILKEKYTLEKVILRTEKLFNEKFNGKLFCMQLTYYDDISFEEDIVYKRDYPKKDKIKDFLTKKALEAI